MKPVQSSHSVLTPRGQARVSRLVLVLGAVLAAWLIFDAPAFRAQETPYKKVVTIEGITEYTLPNGLRFLLFPDPSSSNVTVNMTVLVGSRHEGYGETGMAHLLEHMLFKGSKGFPHPDKDLESHGASYNGTTWTDRTNYYETMPASDANLEFGIKFEADRLVNCFIKREDLAKEMTVVRNEFEQGENDPETILNQRMMAVAFEWHNYGKSTIGNRSDIERVPIENLQAFYRKFYQPDNVVLVVAGKFDEAKALDYISKYFGAIPRPERLLPRTYTEEPAQDGERTVVLRRVGKVSVVGLMYHIPAAAHVEHPAVDMLASILGTSPSGRLYKALVDTKKATRVSADATSWHDPGILEISAVVADGVNPEEVRDIMLDVVENYTKKPTTAAEVDRAKQKYKAAREMALTKSRSIALELSEWAGAGDWRLLFIHRDRVAKVSAEDVDRVAGKYLKQSNRTFGMFIPTTQVARVSVPPTPDVKELVKDYKGGKTIAVGETFDPTPKNIEQRVQRSKLTSGVKLAFLPKKTRGETVVGQVTLHFGNEKSLLGKQEASQVLGSLMMRGTTKRTREQIQDELDRLESKLSAASDLGTLSFTLQTKRDKLSAVLDLLRDILRNPSFPADEFDNILRNAKQGIQKGLTDPQALAFTKWRREVDPHPKDDIRYVPTLEESLQRLEKLSRDDVVKLYKEQLGGQTGEIVLVGDFDDKAVVPQLESLVAGWKTSVSHERITRTANTKVKGSRESILTPDKEGAVYVSGYRFAMKDTDPDYAALTMGNYILGSGFTSRLMDRLRQKEGWSYGAGSQFRADSQDPVATFLTYAICNPENIDKVDKGALEEITKLVEKGITKEELALARKGLLEELKVQRGNDATLAAMLRNTLHLGRTFEYYADLEKKFEALTVEDVNRALARYILPSRLVIVRAGDFKKQ